MSELPIDSYFLERAKAKRGGRVNAYDRINGPSTALVVVDMQDYFVKEGMPSYTPDAQAIVPNINRLAEAVRGAGGLVVWIQTEAPADADDWANRREATGAESWAARRELLARDGAGFGIYPACAVASEDAIAIKYRYSAFIPYPSELDDLLKARGIDTLLIAGVATSTCCESTARDASMWDYRTIMVADANADQTEALHRHTLGKFLIAFGDVQTTDQLTEKLALGATVPEPAE
ncbi:MAG: isochorismatase family cysteine hydrolase [Alphaproteobacteria bacterium]|nr:isochorismatase family cysteine hydrolase [Alphaproteobacteria bacterium]